MVGALCAVSFAGVAETTVVGNNNYRLDNDLTMIAFSRGVLLSPYDASARLCASVPMVDTIQYSAK